MLNSRLYFANTPPRFNKLLRYETKNDLQPGKKSPVRYRIRKCSYNIITDGFDGAVFRQKEKKKNQTKRIKAKSRWSPARGSNRSDLGDGTNFPIARRDLWAGRSKNYDHNERTTVPWVPWKMRTHRTPCLSPRQHLARRYAFGPCETVSSRPIAPPAVTNRIRR